LVGIQLALLPPAPGRLLGDARAFGILAEFHVESIPHDGHETPYSCKLSITLLALHNDGSQHSYTLHRPGLNKALDDIRTGRAGVIFVGKFDRLSRSQLQAAAFRYQVKEQYHGRVESVRELAVTDNPVINAKLTSDYFFVAEMERRDITLRTQGGRRSRVDGGKLITGATLLYGYLWGDPDVRHGKTYYVICDETTAVVRRIFREYVQGTSIRDIVRGLARDHIPTPIGYWASHGYTTNRQYSAR
jgi:DNA invertase Pin-like site-specific DNA recombinase